MPLGVTSGIDIERVRAETPGCETVLHLNNAGSSLMPQAVLDAQIGYLRREAEIGGYEVEDEAHDRIDGTYDSIAALINAGRDEIALVENATVGWDMAFHSFSFQPGDRILTAEAEYASNYIAYLRAVEFCGAKVEVVPSDASGQLDVAALERMIDKRVKLISITHVPTNGGLVNPAEAVGKVARAAGIPFLLDACQSVGQSVVHVERIGCDILTATGRKYLRGPRGTGFLYVRRSLLDRLQPPFVDLHAARWVARDRYVLRPDARRFENWEFNYAAIVGLGVAVDYARTIGMEAIETRVTWLARRLRAILADDMKVPVYDLGEKRCGIVSFSLPDRSAADVAKSLRAQHINVSHSTPASTRIDAEKRKLPDVIRASVHYYNTEDELDRFCAALRRP